MAINTPMNNVSDVLHALMRIHEKPALGWFVDSEGKVRVSLRSEGDFDVGAFAKRFGGGGHKHSAGFAVPSFPTETPSDLYLPDLMALVEWGFAEEANN